MKKKLTGIGIAVMVIAAISITAFIPQEKNNKNEKQQQGRDKGNQDKKDNQGRKDNQGNQDKGNQGNKDDKGNQGNQGNNNGNNNNGNNNSNENKGNNNGKDKNNNGNNGKNNNIDWNNNYGYNWTTESFKDRRKFRNQEKVIICHKFNRNNGSGVSINVSANALKAHMNHGDVMGDCPDYGDRFSDIFIRKRTVYYNYLQETEEQVLYSRSILDFARIRLADSRAQLVVYQNTNMPIVEVQRREAAVVELERNVGLLEALIGGVAGVLVNKLF